MGITSLHDFVAAASPSYALHRLESLKLAAWNAHTIRKQGRGPELRELRALYTTLKQVHDDSHFARTEDQQRLAIMATAEVFRRLDVPADNDTLIEQIGASAHRLLNEEVFFTFPHIDWSVPLDLEDGVALGNFLEHKRHFLLYAPDILELWCQRFVDMWAAILAHLPDAMFRAQTDRTGSFDLSTSLVDLIETPALCVENLLAAVTHKDIGEHHLFEPLLDTITDNLCRVTGIPYEARETSTRAYLKPTKCREPAHVIPELYLRDTPFLNIFGCDVPVDVPDSVRFEHSHVVAGTGHGKTQLFQHLILRDLEQVAGGQASVVVIDSQGDLIDNIAHLDVFAPGNALGDRLVLIDPTDVAFPVALNMFDMNTDAPDPLVQEKLLNGVLELYDYIFGSLLGAELTQKQNVIFRYVARLMLMIPEGSIQHLLRLMEDDGLEDFRSYIAKLDSPTARAFFDNEFSSREFDATRRQVRRRLWGILENKTFEHMFSAPRTKLRLADEMNAGKVILINTSKDLLKQTGTEIFGRFFIALIAQAALERASLPKDQRLPAYVYIDEANDYFKDGDQNVSLILEQARKYKISMTLAHQYLDQLDNKLKASFAANTSIKIAGGLSDKDARVLANDMRTSPDTITAMRKLPDHAEFAIFVKNVTDGAMRLRVPFGQMEALPKMSNEQFDSLRALQRQRYCLPVDEVRATLARGNVHDDLTTEIPDDGADEIASDSGWTATDPVGDDPALAD